MFLIIFHLKNDVSKELVGVLKALIELITNPVGVIFQTKITFHQSSSN